MTTPAPTPKYRIRLVTAMLACLVFAACTVANEPGYAEQNTGHVTRTRIDSWTAILRDDDRGVTCYLWGTTGIACVKDVAP